MGEQPKVPDPSGEFDEAADKAHTEYELGVLLREAERKYGKEYVKAIVTSHPLPF
jgi:hypothetical protein